MADTEELTEEVVHQIAEAVPELVSSLNAVKARYGLLGATIGAAIGGAATWYLVNRKANARADAEIEEMRGHYQAKGVALDLAAGKGDLADLVKEKGYVSEETEKPTSASPPMAVQPPKGAVVLDDSEMGENDVEGPNGVKPQPEVRNIFRERERERERTRKATPDWDLQTELRRRTPDHPYVIHYDERHEMDGYSDVSITYYVKDDVLCNELDEVVDPADRDKLVGDANLDRFGHGSNDPDIVFVRNDNLEIVYEISKSPNSFAEEVHGFNHEDWGRGNLERMRRRERGDDEN